MQKFIKDILIEHSGWDMDKKQRVFDEADFEKAVLELSQKLQQTPCTTQVCQCQRLNGFTLVAGYSYCNTCGCRC